MAPHLGHRPRRVPVTITNTSKGTVLATAERWARSAPERMRGLLDEDHLDPGGALIIDPCNSVHMFGMRFAIDVIFVDKDDRVVRVIPKLQPWRFTRIHLRARRCIELPVGVIAASRTEVGDVLGMG